MSILFATPCYGGQATVEYMRSAIDLRGALVASGVEHDFLFTANESLVQRARNTAVARYLTDPKLDEYEALMFIDADIEFGADDVAKLWNLNVPVACAAYPMKREEAGLTAWKDGKLVDLDLLDEPTTVDFAGTGFLMIRRQVFEQIASAHPEFEHEEGKVGRCWAFFDTGVVDTGAGPYYESEDYHFCRVWRDLGGEIMLDPSIRLGHVGRKTYR